MSLSHVVMYSDFIETRYPQDDSDSADAASCIGYKAVIETHGPVHA